MGVFFWAWSYGRLIYSSSVLRPRLVVVVESSEVVASYILASRRFLLLCFNGSSVGGSRVGRSREVGRFSEGSPIYRWMHHQMMMPD